MSTNMIVIPGADQPAAIGQAPFSSAPASNEQHNPSEAAPAPRRVSFRIDEVDIAQEIAKSVATSIVEDDDDDEYDEGTGDNDNAAICPACPLSTEEEEEDLCTRGLELKTSKQRQQRKFTIIKSIVRNQRQANTENLGKLAKVCNLWAVDVAKVQAEWDYQDAYKGVALNKRELPDMDRYPMPFKKKRRSTTEHHEQQRTNKRIKTC